MPATPLMEQVLGAELANLPPPIRRLADVYDVERFAGIASVERGTGFLSRLAGRLISFPAATPSIPVEVTKTVTPSGEDWTRRFGAKSFVSHLSHRASEPGILRERFGPMSFSIRLTVADGRVHWPVERWRFLGVPMPAALKPKSETVEFVDADGRFNFHVDVSLPLAGLVVRYRGWLEPA